ncbi:unnamed protein product, partial [Ixodes hexagonus]
MPVQAPQWTEFLSCPVCCRGFDGAERRPTSLGCGHTLCGRCLAQLQRRLCPFDQAPIGRALPENGALLQLVAAPPGPPVAPPGLGGPQRAAFQLACRCVQEMALLLRPAAQGGCGGWLSRPLQRKLVTLVHCQLAEPEGRLRAVRAARSLGERCAMELLLQHQSGQQLSASLWAAVRARGCQFLGPHMQEEVLRLVLLALEDGSPLSRKVLVLFVVQRLAPHFPQASKTSIGHVVQLLYRASCFKVSKREGDSSLMQLKEEFCTYEALRREHDAQIVQIATEAGLRIAPEQWSSLLYGDTAHKSHMQSIIDKLQSPQSFGQSVQELVIALQRTGDPGSLSLLRPHLELLAALDPSPEASWEEVGHSVEAAHAVVHGLVGFLGSFGGRGKLGAEALPQGKYKTSLCRDLAQRGSCPRGVHCTFAHSQEEVDRRGPSCTPSHRPLTGSQTGTLLCSREWCNTISLVPTRPSFSVLRTSHLWTNSAVISTSVSSPTDTVRHLLEGRPAPQPECEQKHLLIRKHLWGGGVGKGGMQPDPRYLSLNEKLLLFTSGMQPFCLPFKNKKEGTEKVLPMSASTKLINYGAVQNMSLPGVIEPPGNLRALPRYEVLKHSVSATCSCREPLRSTSIPSRGPRRTLLWCARFCSVGLVHFLPQDIASQSLAELQQRKQEIMAKLGEPHDQPKVGVPRPCGEDCCTGSGMAALPAKYVRCPQLNWRLIGCVQALSFSPWTSASLFERAAAGPPAAVGNACSCKPVVPVVVRVAAVFLLPRVHCPRCPSEEDPFVPFDPPLVSKYGPISRCARSLVRGPAPIQVTSQRGNLTSPTAALRHPLPSASAAPSLYA